MYSPQRKLKISIAAKNAKSAKKSFIMVFKFCAFLRALRQKNTFSLRLNSLLVVLNTLDCSASL